MENFSLVTKRTVSWCLFLFGYGLSGPAVFAQEAAELENAKRFPVIEFGLDENQEARLHPLKLPDLKAGEYFGIRFRTPSWLNGNVAWLLLDLGDDQEEPVVFESRLFSGDGDPLAVYKSHLLEVEQHPRLQKRFPGVRGLTYQTSAKKNGPKGDREYLLALRTTKGPLPPMALGLTITSEKGYYETGFFPLWDGPKLRFLAGRDFMRQVIALRKQKGDEAALRSLDYEFRRRSVTSENFRSLYHDCWIEAQTGTGRDELLWGSRLNDLIFRVCVRHRYYHHALKIIPNLSIAMGAAKRHGRRSEVLSWWARAQEAAGLKLDPTSYPDQGAAIPELPEVRRRNIPYQVPTKAKHFGKYTPSSLPEEFDRISAASFSSWAEDCSRRGRWQEALEWRVWIMDWAEKGYLKEKNHELGNLWYSEGFQISQLLGQLGFEEGAMEYCRQLLGSTMANGYGGRTRHRAEIDLLAWEITRGLTPPDKLKRLDEVAEKLRTNRYSSLKNYRDAMTRISSAMIAVGQKSDGLARLETLVDEGHLAARWARLQHWCQSGRVDGVETEFLRYLEAVRQEGDKLREAKIYALYADFLEANERFGEALQIRQEAIRLNRGFRLFVHLPVELAKHSSLLSRLGREKEAAEIEAEARGLIGKKYRIPARVVKQVEEILKTGGKSIGPSKKRTGIEIDLQPLSSFAIPVEGVPLETRLTLINYSDREVSGTLAADGMPVTLVAKAAEREIDVLLGQAGARSLPVTIEAGRYWSIVLTRASEDSVEGNLEFSWISDHTREEQKSQVEIARADEGIRSSVIEAGEYRQNPFYGVMIHHHYVNTTGVISSPPVRFVSSVPTRIEIYQGHDDAPLAIDANGNGSVLDPSDELFAESNGDGKLLLPLDHQAAFIRLEVFPEEDFPEEGITIQFQVHSENGWETQSENRIIR